MGWGGEGVGGDGGEGGDPLFALRSNRDIFTMRHRMKVGVGAIESYESVGCAWGAWSVIQALAHIRHSA